jgi:uncharacterized protein (UPF0147 family)
MNAEKGIETLKNQKSHNKIQSAFGVYEKRFVVKDMKVPGPGKYKADEALSILQNKKHSLLALSSSFLATPVVR